MKTLIIGCKGFIGNHAWQYFSKSFLIECWGCDIVVDYTSKNYILLTEFDNDFNKIFQTHKFDVCVNCSGAASVPDSFNSPLRDYTLNTYNVAKILEAIRNYSPKCKFINFSSAAVYGNPAELPIMDNSVCKPLSPYGKHKLAAEELCKEYHQYFNIQTCTVRVFSAYGPGLKKQILWDIFQKSVNGKVVNLFGTGNETRDFIYIYDIVKIIELIILKGSFEASVYNVGNGTETTINTIATTLLKELNYKGDIVFSMSERLGDPLHWQANILKLLNLGYKQTVTITEGIKYYVQWLKEEKLV